MSLPRLRLPSTGHLAPLLALAVFFIAVPAASGIARAAGERPVATRSQGAETVRGWLQSTAGDGQVKLPAGGRLLDNRGGEMFVELPAAALGTLKALGLTFRPVQSAHWLAAGGERFDVRQGEPDLPVEWQAFPPTAGRHPYLVKFDAPVRPEWMQRLAETGAVPLQYMPSFGYLVLVPVGKEAKLSNLEHVEFAGAYHPAYKAAPSLRARARGSSPLSSSAERLTLRIVFFDMPGWEAGIEVVSQTGGRLVNRSDLDSTSQRRLLHYTIFENVPAHALPSILAEPMVYVAEEWQPPQHDGERAAQITAGNVSAGAALPDYYTWLLDVGADGSGVTVAIADTGFDTGDPNTVHVDVRGRITFATALCGANSDTDGHGTNVAAIAVGDPRSGSGGSGLVDGSGFHWGSGSAPGADLYFQKAFGGGGCSSYNANAATLAADAVGVGGAQIGSHSFTDGAGGGGAYNSQAQAWDAAVRDADTIAGGNQPYAVHFSAGNSGPGSGSLTTPKAAKNIVTVGATENDRPGECPGISGCGGSADDPDALVSFSSRGPTDDGRIKPDVSAPGHVIVGGLSSAASYSCACDSGGGSGCCATEGIDTTGAGLYTRYSGTSQASPRVAGAAAVVFDWFKDQTASFPSPAMSKAILINSAVDMKTADVPNNNEGWGRVALNSVLESAVDVSFTDQTTVIGTTGDGGAFTTNLYVQDPALPVKATVVWTDAPGSVGCNPCLVNDLDLLLTQGGNTWHGNNFAGGFTTTDATADSLNNVEGIHLAPVSLSCTPTFQVKVRAQSLAGDGVPGNGDTTDQDFALVVRNAGTTPSSTPASLQTPSHSLAASCDGDAFLDRAEIATVAVDMANTGCTGASGVMATMIVLSAPPGAAVSVFPAGAQSVGAIGVGSMAAPTWNVSLASNPSSFCGETVTLQVDMTDDAAGMWSDTVEIVLDGESLSAVTDVDDASTDNSFTADAEWGLEGCRTISSPTSWHMGQSDCSGIVRDASERNLVFRHALGTTDVLTSLSFSHAFDGYANGAGTLRDSVTVEIDHDLDGSFNVLQTWQEGLDAPLTMTAAGPYDLSSFNAGRAASIDIRFRFNSAANWVGGPNNADGWDVDDITLKYDSLVCDPGPGTTPAPVPNGSGSTTPLTVERDTGGGLEIMWGAVAGATGYNIYTGTVGSYYDHQIFTDPGLDGADSCAEPGTSVTVQMPAGNVYFLVATSEGCLESPLGFDSLNDPVPYAASPCSGH